MSGTIKKGKKKNQNNKTSLLKVLYQKKNPFWKSHSAQLCRFRYPTSNGQGVPNVEIYDMDAIQKLSKHSRTCCVSSDYLY